MFVTNYNSTNTCTRVHYGCNVCFIVSDLSGFSLIDGATLNNDVTVYTDQALLFNATVFEDLQILKTIPLDLSYTQLVLHVVPRKSSDFLYF